MKLYSILKMDWSLCAICQKKSPESLKCPLDSLQEGTGLKAYENFLKNVAKFRECEDMPVQLKFASDVNPSVFVDNRAAWHKQCHLKFSNSKLGRVLVKKRKADDDECKVDQRKSKRKLEDNTLCIFCGLSGEDLHHVTTLGVHDNVKKMATELQDTDLLAKLAAGDMIAIEAKYHRKCMLSLRHRYRSLIRKSTSDESTKVEEIAEARAFTELISYMASSSEIGVHIFKLSELHKLYVQRLCDLGFDKTVNKTRLKNKIVSHFAENIQEQADGRNTLLVFKDGMKSILKDALASRDIESEFLDYAKVAKNIRSEVFGSEMFKFSGSFPFNCQYESVPPSLMCLISMLLNGSNINEQETDISQACLTIAQLIIFNTKKSTPATKKTRHSQEREPPLPLYLGLNVHTQTRSKKLVNTLYHMGLCVSYSRVEEVLNALATSVCKKFNDDGIVCPLNLRSGLYTVGALDNIDHNPSSTTSQGSFHGTGISIFQFPNASSPGGPKPTIEILKSDSGKVKDFSLPDDFSTVPAVSFKTAEVCVSRADCNYHSKGHLDNALSKENCWFEHSNGLLEKELANNDFMSWAGYHASLVEHVKKEPAISGLLPLFYEKAASISMVKHGMDVLRKTTEYLNPGQLPVLTVDQPLYTIAKYIQWKWPQTYGEDIYITMLGGLHIEMALWSLCGDLLEASGWTTALIDSGVASSGTADSFLKVSHLTRTRHVHQVTALVLSKLQQDAFISTNDDHNEETFSTWKSNLLKCSPTFQFWDMILRLETLILIFIKAHREIDFPLFVETLEALVPWFFALDHVNYARWLPVFIRDMKSLPEGVYANFQKHWVISKTDTKFSSIPIDQAHEQNNAIVKGSGGAVGLTENPVAFRRWMVAGPEMARLLKEFENDFLPDDDIDSNKHLHHEQGLSTQKTFQKQVNSLRETITQMGNPFCDNIPELVALDTRDCADISVINTVRSIEEVGYNLYKKYVKDVLEDKTTPIQDPIKRNSLALFKRQEPKAASKTTRQLSALKSDCGLFSRLYIASHHREGDLNNFFQHENQSYPPSLSDFGKLHFGKKSDLLSCLEVPNQPEQPRSFHAKVFDGAAIVHALPVASASTFLEYANKVFIPFLVSQLQSSNRIDVVWDVYLPNSLKEATREKRGKGTRKKVAEQTKLPRDWKGFLQDSSNKEELFSLLSSKVQATTCPENKAIFITSGENILSTRENFVSFKCNHEEADTRIILHILYVLQDGHSNVLVRTVDTDVVVLLIGHFHEIIGQYPLADIWVAFGMGKHFRHLNINTICNSLGECKSKALPLFHAFTGCDSTSSFSGRGKKSCWGAWKSYPEATDVFIAMKENPFQPLSKSAPNFCILERLTVVIYDKTSSSSSVDEARRELFTRMNRSLENIPPTQVRLLDVIIF